jgi:hypothetical protein
MFGDFFRRQRPAAYINPVDQMPPDWVGAFEGAAPFGVSLACIKDLHLRLLVLEGDLAESERLRKLHAAKLKALGIENNDAV